MQWKSVLRMSMVAIPVMIVFGLLVPVSSIGPTARADNEDTKACSNKTHHGDYGFALEGEILGLGFQVRGVVMQHYEGEGSFTQVDHVVINGEPPAEEWRPGSGTYTVNPDCTGTATINIPGPENPPILLNFVISHGTEIHQVVDGNAITAVGKKVESN
jgi:hypothetical protein